MSDLDDLEISFKFNVEELIQMVCNISLAICIVCVASVVMEQQRSTQVLLAGSFWTHTLSAHCQFLSVTPLLYGAILTFAIYLVYWPYKII